MVVPDWRGIRRGTRVRVALWLISEVGVGHAFTKAQLREAFPGVEQVDRRMRDLRADGWVIATYREDRSLSADELRFVSAGGPVWERGYKSKATANDVTTRVRQQVMAADGFVCLYCGIGGGEPYPDDAVRTAKLTVTRAESTDDSGSRLVTLCDRCRLRSGEDTTADSLIAAIEALDPESREILRDWVARGERQRNRLDELWAAYRCLPWSDRARIQELV
jgi:hypothetical protein